MVPLLRTTPSSAHLKQVLAELGCAREVRVCFRHRLLQPASVLSEYFGFHTLPDEHQPLRPA